jgi:hypothetical protein
MHNTPAQATGSSPDEKAPGQAQPVDGETKPLLNPADPASSPTVPVSACTKLAVVLVIACMLVLPFAGIGYLGWQFWLQGQVTASQPIGTLRQMGAGDGWGSAAVLETETGFYPLLTSVAARKGVALILESRGNGMRFICDAQRHTCVMCASSSLE